jgi:hypothetical protein
MIELDLDVEDLVGMRFAVSPLMETIASRVVHTVGDARRSGG